MSPVSFRGLHDRGPAHRIRDDWERAYRSFEARIPPAASKEVVHGRPKGVDAALKLCNVIDLDTDIHERNSANHKGGGLDGDGRVGHGGELVYRGSHFFLFFVADGLSDDVLKVYAH